MLFAFYVKNLTLNKIKKYNKKLTINYLKIKTFQNYYIFNVMISYLEACFFWRTDEEEIGF